MMAYREVRYGNSPGISLTPAVKWLIVANVIAFLCQLLWGPVIEYWLALWPNARAGVIRTMSGYWPYNGFYPWQLLTYGFLHSTSNLMHIGFNMLALWMFGQSIEQALGTKRFVIYYLVCVVGAGLVHMAYAFIVQSPIPVVGASGGVYGVLLAFGMLFPYARVMLLFFPVPIEARWLVIIYGAIEFINGVSGTSQGVAHFAHLGGMLFGFFMIQFWRGRFPFRGRQRL